MIPGIEFGFRRFRLLGSRGLGFSESLTFRGSGFGFLFGMFWIKDIPDMHAMQSIVWMLRA